MYHGLHLKRSTGSRESEQRNHQQVTYVTERQSESIPNLQPITENSSRLLLRFPAGLSTAACSPAKASKDVTKHSTLVLVTSAPAVFLNVPKAAGLRQQVFAVVENPRHTLCRC